MGLLKGRHAEVIPPHQLAHMDQDLPDVWIDSAEHETDMKLLGSAFMELMNVQIPKGLSEVKAKEIYDQES